MPSTPTHLAIWNKALNAVRDQIPAQSFDGWLKHLKPAGPVRDGVLELLVLNDIFARQVHARFGPLLEETLSLEAREPIRLSYKVDGGERAEELPSTEADAPSDRPTQDKGRTPMALDARYTFDSFVVGSCNQFVHAAAQRVADSLATSYNPLFIYGGSGLGKTHIMQAIGNHVLQSRPSIKFQYTTAEKFMTQLINSIRYDRMFEFKEHYRSLDILMVDDIQFIAGKERTQEEFFHTFNALYETNKQIIITSDKYPKEIENLEERLRSRFGWGLVADIQPPELETRIAILKKKAADEGLNLPDDVAFFLANAIQTNIRELEGALIRIKAYASLTHKPITMDMVKETLRDIVKIQEKLITTDNIMKLVANYYKVRTADLRSEKRTRLFSHPRQVAMYLCKQLTPLSYPDIGKEFGGRDHTTVMHAVRKITEQRVQDGVLDEELESLTGMLRR